MKPTALSTMMPAASAQFARISARERKLLAGLALAALVVAPVKTFDWAQAAGERQVQAQQALDTALQAARGARGGGVQGQLAQQRKDIANWSWQAPSAPIGRVVAQDQITSIAIRAGMTGAEIKPADKIEKIGEVDFAKIEIDAPFAWPSFTAFLSGLAATGKGFMIDSLTVQDDVKPRLKLVLKLPIAVISASVS